MNNPFVYCSLHNEQSSAIALTVPSLTAPPLNAHQTYASSREEPTIMQLPTRVPSLSLYCLSLNLLRALLYNTVHYNTVPQEYSIIIEEVIVLWTFSSQVREAKPSHSQHWTLHRRQPSVRSTDHWNIIRRLLKVVRVPRLEGSRRAGGLPLNCERRSNNESRSKLRV